MKIVRIIGGLGNQMFQYALLISLREHFKQPVLADISSFKGYELHNGFELTKIFGISPVIATKKELKKLTYYSPSYRIQRIIRHLLPKRKTECIESLQGDYVENIFTDANDMYYEGYWQNYRYFAEYQDIIQKEFSFNIPALNDDNQRLVNIINNDSSIWVSVHVRRGDYVNHKILGGICDINYYKSAIEYIKRKSDKPLCFLILSNDADWCRENLGPLILGHTCEYVDWNNGINSYLDMYLMTLCRVNIIANSSFSWWGAYLNKNKNKITIAPRKWENTPAAFKRQLPEWILI